jgi:hypothetical protein
VCCSLHLTIPTLTLISARFIPSLTAVWIVLFAFDESQPIAIIENWTGATGGLIDGNKECTCSISG